MKVAFRIAQLTAYIDCTANNLVSTMYTCIHVYTLQRWGRAYRDTTYRAAVDTNNGVEPQNKVVKYNHELELTAVIKNLCMV